MELRHARTKAAQTVFLHHARGIERLRWIDPWTTDGRCTMRRTLWVGPANAPNDILIFVVEFEEASPVIRQVELLPVD